MFVGFISPTNIWGPGADPWWLRDPYMHRLTDEFNPYVRRLIDEFSYFFTTTSFSYLPGCGASKTCQYISEFLAFLAQFTTFHDNST
jgi:hypothetical protein